MLGQMGTPEIEVKSRGQMEPNYSNDLVFNDENNIEDMYLTFGVGSEDYGIGIGHVTEIVGMQRIMQVPDVPPFIKGVINLRGKVIPVMDVRCRFNMDEKAYTERTVIIVLDVASVPIGLIVDNVSEVLEIAPNNIDPAPKFGASRDGSGVIRGLGRSGDRVAIILDIDRMVAIDDGRGRGVGSDESLPAASH